MHPIERLRYLARSSGHDQRVLVGETASALRAMRMDPAGLVVSCRRIVERHPTSGPLWWLCAHVLTAPDPSQAARDLPHHLEMDPTPDLLAEALPEDATVLVIGWPDLAGEACLGRGDLTVLTVDADGEGHSFVRRLERSDVVAEIVEPAGLSAAVLAADVVLVEAVAASTGEILATRGSRAAASVAYCSEVPLWAVVGRGRCLPDAAFTNLVERVGAVRVPWDAEADVVPLGLVSHVAGERGVLPVESAGLAPECPLAHELLRSRPGT
ncbi:MAG: hypothetical protein ACOYMR_11285 [Ilumatobacteraceae bacterium]